MSNCANCGAPPRKGLCPYCGTDASVPDPRVPDPRVSARAKADYAHALKALDAFDFDPPRGTAVLSLVRVLRARSDVLTAGQVHQVLRMFDYDPYRLEAARRLVTVVVDALPLLNSADLFDFDPYRAQFVEVVTQANPARADAEAFISEVVRAAPDESARAPTAPPSPGFTGWLIGVLVLFLGGLAAVLTCLWWFA